MAYYSRHSIFLQAYDEQKLSLIQSILDDEGLSFETTAPIALPSRNYNFLPSRIKAQQILYDHLLERRNAGTLHS